MIAVESVAGVQSALLKGLLDHFLCVAAAAMMTVASTTARADPLPRTTDGKPDLSGIWQTLSTAEWDLEPHAARNDAPAGLGVVVGEAIPYRPEAVARRKENFEKRATADPRTKCYMPGVPRVTYTPLPFQIFQSPDHVTVLYEYAHSVRQIYTNGTGHPDGHIDWWLGDSRGHWEADTLVVDVIDFNDETWLDRSGNFHSDELHVVERYTPLDADHIRYEATVEDSKVFTRPWTIDLVLYRHREPNFQLLEFECHTFGYEKYYP
jgi:hypothetical protein